MVVFSNGSAGCISVKSISAGMADPDNGSPATDVADAVGEALTMGVEN
jgi:hypothetical protein